MKNILTNKGVIVFYLFLIATVYVSIWRFERLDEKVVEPGNKIVFNIN